MTTRREFLAASVLLPAWLAACSRDDGWPEGMVPIVWDRDTCARCSMVISDRRFAAELRGAPKNAVVKFDDIGCAVFWLREHANDTPWLRDAATHLWVADAANQGDVVAWHDATLAHYIGKTSPMAYNFAAVLRPQAGSVDYATMRGHVLAKGK